MAEFPKHIILRKVEETKTEVKYKDVTPLKQGKWEYDSDGIPKCSCCEETALQRILLRFPKPEYVSHFVLSNFCPNCGARMDGGT